MEVIALHHGLVLKGDPQRYYQALRQNPVGDIVDAGFYEGKLPSSV